MTFKVTAVPVEGSRPKTAVVKLGDEKGEGVVGYFTGFISVEALDIAVGQAKDRYDAANIIRKQLTPPG